MYEALSRQGALSLAQWSRFVHHSSLITVKIIRVPSILNLITPIQTREMINSSDFLRSVCVWEPEGAL